MALAAAAAGLVWCWLPHHAATEIAARTVGERWYLVAFRHTPIGQYHTASGVTASHDFEFRTALRFTLDGTTETRDETRLVFRRWPPHGLREAHRRVQVGEATTEVAYRDGVATVFEPGRQRRIATRLDYRLADHLAVERWIESAAAPGDRRAGRLVDLDRVVVAPVSWQLLERGVERVVVAGAWRLDASFEQAGAVSSRLTFDGQGAPQRVEVADVIAMQRVADATAAGVWRRAAPVFSTTGMGVAADRPIAAPAALRALTVAVESTAAAWTAWPATLAADVDGLPVSSDEELAAARMATVRYPADDAQLRRLARRAVAGLEDMEDWAPALTRFVHRHLRYRDTGAARTVLDTVRDRTGDCTEYADLLTTLARSLELPARTVVGLAYRADAQEFVLHAWNEVAVRGRWRGVDPTWDQAPSDATHLPLPTEAALAAIAELPQLRFRVLETRY